MCATTNAEEYHAIEVQVRENELSGGSGPLLVNRCLRTEDP